VNWKRGPHTAFVRPAEGVCYAGQRSERSMELIEEFLYRVKTAGPLKTTKGSPDGERNY
jgi:hypothetical protein